MPKPADSTHAFFADADVQHLRAQAAEDRALFVLFPGEVPMSRFLAWLLSPHEGHGLGDRAIKALLYALWQLEEQPAQASLAGLQPARVAQVSFDNAFVLREFALDEAGRIDLLVVDPQHGCVLAIEHKFGAKLGRDQLQRYRQALERRFAGWKRIHVYLDSDEADGEQDALHWFRLDYRWIRELLQAQIERGRLGAAGEQTLRQFLVYLDDEQAPGALPQTELARGLRVAARHAEVVARFGELQRASWPELLQQLQATPADALLREYCQQWRLWDEVVALGRFAPFHGPLAQRHGDALWWHAARKVAYFTLRGWRRWDVDGDAFPALWARVRRTGDGDEVELDAGIAVERLQAAARAPLLQALTPLRARYGLRNKAKTGARFVFLARSAAPLPGAAACARMLELMRDIEQALAALPPHPAGADAAHP
jgi:hypothetical protein